MEPREVSAIFLRNEFPFEMDESMTQYLAEILTDQSISREDQDELVTTLLISAYGEDIQPILTRILKDMNNKLKNNQRMSQKKKKEMMSQNSSQSLPVSIPLLQSPSQQAKKDLFPAKVGKSLESKKDQSYFLPPKAPEVESPQLRSLRSILMENGVTTDSLDETITEYLIEVCANEMISLEELQEIILTYFPSLDGDAAKAKRVVLSLISSTSSQDPPPSAVPLSLTPHSMEVEESDYVDEVESKSYGSDLEQRDEDWESEESELTLVNVDEVQEIFPVLPRLTLQYIHRVKCFDNFAETCQYLLDHQTDEDLEQLSSLAVQYHEKSLQRRRHSQREEDHLKKKIFDRYGDQVVLRDDSSRGRKKKEGSETEKMKVLAMIGNQSNQKVRYRDNKIASTKGEKIIVEKNPKDDYDGGSRGKVKTKGKRGPGFVMS